MSQKDDASIWLASIEWRPDLALLLYAVWDQVFLWTKHKIAKK